MCACVCNISSFLVISRAVRGRFPQTRKLWKRASVGERVGRVSSHVVSRWSRSPCCCGFRGVFLVGADFFVFFSIFVFSSNAHGLLQVRGRLLPHFYLSTSTDFEGCTRPISTNPGSMKAGEYELTRGTCFVTRRLELVAVDGLW